jgi:hypothetical protein
MAPEAGKSDLARPEIGYVYMRPIRRNGPDDFGARVDTQEIPGERRGIVRGEEYYSVEAMEESFKSACPVLHEEGQKEGAVSITPFPDIACLCQELHDIETSCKMDQVIGLPQRIDRRKREEEISKGAMVMDKYSPSHRVHRVVADNGKAGMDRSLVYAMRFR